MGLGDRLRKGMYLLGTMLVGEGLASEEQVQAALGEQSRQKKLGGAHKRLGQLLIEMSAVSSEDVDRVVDEQRRAREATSQAASAVVEEQAPPAQPAATSPPPTADADGAYVASANGQVYHAVDCRAAGRIRAANTMRFATVEEAEEAGKRACSKCC